VTLILTLQNSEVSVLVADRRRTRWDAKQQKTVVVDEETAKLTELVVPDARLGVAFTGLASDGRGFETEKWIASALAEAGGHGDRPVRQILATFEQSLNERWAKITTPRPEDKRLSIVVAGYLGDEDLPRAHFWRLSNWERENEWWNGPPFEKFVLTGMRESRPATVEPALVGIAGALGVIPQETLDRLAYMLEERASPQNLTRRAVAAIREASEHPGTRGTVGKRCLSLVLPGDPGTEPTAMYHPEADSEVVYGVDKVVVTPEIQIAMIRPELRVKPGGPPIARAKVPRNDPCPCGSGKKYKKCHGRAVRRRGAFFCGNNGPPGEAD
jgi:hypothetical protein